MLQWNAGCSRFGIPIAWYEARIPGFPRISRREGASSLFGRGPERPKIVSCSRATPRVHRCNHGVALEQETILGLSGPRPKRLLAPSLIDIRGNPGIRASYQAIGIPNLEHPPRAWTPLGCKFSTSAYACFNPGRQGWSSS